MHWIMNKVICVGVYFIIVIVTFILIEKKYGKNKK